MPKNPPSKAQCRKQRNAFLFDTNIICWLHDTGVNTVDDQKPFLVVGMIFSDVILGQKFVMIIGKQTFYWSKTGFFSVFQLKKVNNNKFLLQNFVISSQNNIPK